MKDNKRNISERFSQFEPETDENNIDKGWEKIKYFLPEEKKRRGVVFFRKRGLALYTFSIAVFCMGVIALKYLNKNQNETIVLKKKSNVPIKQSTDAANNRKGSIAKNTTTRQSPLKKNSKPVNPDKRDSAKDVGKTEGGLPAFPVTNSFVSREKQPGSVFVSVKKHRKEENSVSDETLNDKLVSDISNVQVNLEEDSIPYFKMQPLRVEFLSLSIPMDSIREPSILTREQIPFGEARPKKMSLELIAGPNQTWTKFEGGDKNQTITRSKTNFSFAMGLIYLVTEKWNISGNLGFGTDKLDYSEETTGNRILDRKITTSVLPSSEPIKYVKVHSVSKVSSQWNCNLNLGVGYAFFQKQRLKIEVGVYFSLRTGAYKISHLYTQETDTLAVIGNPNAPPVNNIVGNSPPDNIVTYNPLTFGVRPVFLFSYNLSRKLTFVLKPSYYYQMSEYKKGFSQYYFSLKQTNGFIDLGLRFKL